MVGSAAGKRATQIVNDVATDSRHLKMGGDSGFVTRNLIATPMLRNERLIGVLEVLNKQNGAAFDEMDAKVMEILSEQAAMQIENARLIRDKLKAERLAALGTTAAGLAHYIKNVLSQWKGSASLIDIGLANNNSELIGEAWPILKRANDKISKLVQDMLTISREREPER
ncbi:GAF domain-containing protein, partial [Candidatus Sumerlaeota bacterium]|nr:GAF domain-containing protein [Candidatus Sumerlaeota bacterium]